MEHAAEIAAVGTATCWAIGATCFEVAGRRIGSLSLNLMRWVSRYVCFRSIVSSLAGALCRLTHRATRGSG
jgi:hypothetical protein